LAFTKSNSFCFEKQMLFIKKAIAFLFKANAFSKRKRKRKRKKSPTPPIKEKEKEKEKDDDDSYVRACACVREIQSFPILESLERKKAMPFLDIAIVCCQKPLPF
jgi:hypothetical protein